MENRIKKILDLENLGNFSAFIAVIGALTFFRTGETAALELSAGATLMFAGGFVLYYRREKLLDNSGRSDGE